MSEILAQHIFVVDDERGVCTTISETLEQFGAKVTCFLRADECLEQLPSQRCDLLITDLKMPEMDGMELVRSVRHLTPWVPILVVTGYGDIPTAVKAIRAGAADFIEKPLRKAIFVDKVESILRGNGNRKHLAKCLTKCERTVLWLVIEGKTNREIASLLSRSVRTIEVHRSNIMHKLGVDNLVDLVKLAGMMQMVGSQED